MNNSVYEILDNLILMLNYFALKGKGYIQFFLFQISPSFTIINIYFFEDRTFPLQVCSLQLFFITSSFPQYSQVIQIIINFSIVEILEEI